MARRNVQSLWLVVVLAVGMSACQPVVDQFQGYTVWVANHAQEDRYVYLGATPGETLNFAYVAPSDGVLRQAGFVAIGSLDATDVGGLIVVFDADCHELGRARVGPGTFVVALFTDSIHVEPAVGDGVDPVKVTMAGTPLKCE